jgi:pyrroline-5-carboxylate reductase
MRFKKKIGFIGCGNMATAILKGIINKKFLSKEDILIYDIDHEKTAYLKKYFGFEIAQDIEKLLDCCANILIAVKPQNIGTVLEYIKKHKNKDQVMISIAAGISIALIKNRIGQDAKVVRIMPNMPALYNKGISVVSASPELGKSEYSFVKDMVKSFGECVEVEENLQNLSMTLSGCGPAYFFLFCKTMIDYAVSEGLDASISKKLVLETMAGSYEVAKNSSNNLDELIGQVKSPGGTTEKALEKFSELGLKAVIQEGLKAALRRSFELQKGSEG